MAGIFQAEKAGYPLNMKVFWPSDKFRIRADSSRETSVLPADGWLFGSITYTLDFWRGSQVTIFKSITKML
jgi:hypothetical protein